MVRLQAAFADGLFLAPPVTGELSESDGSHRISRRAVLRYKNVSRLQLREDLLGLVLRLSHSFILHPARRPTSERTTFQGADQLRITSDARPPHS